MDQSIQVEQAQLADLHPWLALAAEVEFLFGPMVADPAFHAVLERNIARHTAWCVREQAGVPGTPLKGAVLFSATRAPHYTVGWLAVAQRWRRGGVARGLVAQCLAHIQRPAELSVITFGADNPAGQPARRFYERMGFSAAEMTSPGPEGGTRQVFRQWLA